MVDEDLGPTPSPWKQRTSILTGFASPCNVQEFRALADQLNLPDGSRIHCCLNFAKSCTVELESVQAQDLLPDFRDNPRSIHCAVRIYANKFLPAAQANVRGKHVKRDGTLLNFTQT
eukprot:6263387-Amphidinium_carterae.1